MLLYFDEIDSTNDYLKRNYMALDDKTIVVAKHQTKGKGRLSRTWLDSGLDLTTSILLKDVKGEISNLSLIASYAVFKALKSLDLAISIKWPNDIYYGEKKLCGILIETIISNSITAIIGIGVNTNSKEFSDNLNATSIALEKNIVVDNNELAKKIFDELVRAIDLPFSEIVKLNRENAFLIGKNVELNYYDENLKGKVVDLLENGNILLDLGEKTIEIHSGEISLKKKK